MNDEDIVTFCEITSATPAQAQRFLSLADGNVEQSVELFFTNPELGNQAATQSAQPQSNSNNPITIDDDDANDNEDDDDEVREIGSRTAGPPATYEDDEAMARRLQEEMYGGRGPGDLGGGDPDAVRAPIARTTETLVGGDTDWRDDPNEMRAAIAQQMMARDRRRAAPGIFNQRTAASIWNNDDPTNPERHRQVLSRATGGASDQTAKSNLLADLFRPPFDIISPLSLSDAREEGKENEKWILVNVQDSSIFDCQVLNRDVWKNQSIKETIKEHFIFLQYQKDDPRGQEYMNYYFSAMRDHEDAYPHIAIIDPRTGEQVKTWSGSPGPKAADFLMELHEFLDRYSLNMQQKNPVQAKRMEKKKKDVDRMSEEEMLEMALQNSLQHGGAGGGAGPSAREIDPDSLTRPAAAADSSSTSTSGPDMMDITPTEDSTPTTSKDSPFARISAASPHEEPATNDATITTRIQFRYSGGRVVRRFLLSDHVLRIYEWLKASPIQGHDAQTFDLISAGKNMIESLDVTIADAGLKNATVMVEFDEES